jgi:geranylgeranyl diphosphate synthase, type II
VEAFEDALRAVITTETQNGPLPLRNAMRYAVFPGGGRIRPELVFSIVKANLGSIDKLTMGAAMAVELIHCASLVHDDLPCFDDAAFRRNKPTIHRVFGESTAVLVGDALIGMAFNVIAENGEERPALTSDLIRILAKALGPSEGLIAGQAFEKDLNATVAQVHAGKTGALFEASTMFGALAAGAKPEPWRIVGQKIGQAYQVADDLMDAYGSAAEAGKPVAQDARHQRPNAARQVDLYTAKSTLDQLVHEAISALPLCAGRQDIAALLTKISARLCPRTLTSNPAKKSTEATIAPVVDMGTIPQAQVQGA